MMDEEDNVGWMVAGGLLTIYVLILALGCVSPSQPTVTIQAAEDWVNVSEGYLDFTACDSQDPLLDCEILVEDSFNNSRVYAVDNVSCETTSVWITLWQGENTVTVGCVDDAGFRGTDTLSLKCDTESPSVEILGFREST